MVVVNVIHGIGAGILINGRLFQGDGGGAGEIGHVVVQENGELCRCGKRGCLETVASARAVVKRMKMNSLGEAVSSFNAGNAAATAVIENAGRYLGVSLANLIATLNIQKIVLTGDMTRFGEKWLNAVSDSMQAGVFSRISEGAKLEIGKLDYRACILGASAFLLLDDYSLLFNEEN
jgi:predicted NBD/HSP70 family sugar kinase